MPSRPCSPACSPAPCGALSAFCADVDFDLVVPKLPLWTFSAIARSAIDPALASRGGDIPGLFVLFVVLIGRLVEFRYSPACGHTGPVRRDPRHTGRRRAAHRQRPPRQRHREYDDTTRAARPRKRDVAAKAHQSADTRSVHTPSMHTTLLAELSLRDGEGDQSPNTRSPWAPQAPVAQCVP